MTARFNEERHEIEFTMNAAELREIRAAIRTRQSCLVLSDLPYSLELMRNATGAIIAASDEFVNDDDLADEWGYYNQ